MYYHLEYAVPIETGKYELRSRTFINEEEALAFVETKGIPDYFLYPLDESGI